MEIGLIIIIGMIVTFLILLYLGSSYLERRYYEKHPPDDWDGCREDRDTDEEDEI